MRTLDNISERKFAGTLLKIFKPLVRLSTMDWARQYRTITSSETSVGVGKFDPNITPYMEYVYDCLDNPHIPVICAQKPARIAWTETINNYRGKRMHIQPTNMLLGFPTTAAARTFAKGKWKEFITNTPALRNIVNIGVAKNKESYFDYEFENGSLRLRTLGSITSVKSDNLPYIEIEEPDDAKDDVNGQGDLLANLRQRQKTVPLTMRKLIFGGTPTHLDFSRVSNAIKASNQLVFKAECHCCKNLVTLNDKAFPNIVYGEYPERRIDEIYGKNNPYSAKFFCPYCKEEWSFEQKNKNIIAGKQHGFIDHTGKHSKGWHPLRPEITDCFGFIFSELLSPFDGSNFVELSKTKILADLDMARGKEGLMKSYFNNTLGIPYASGFSAMSAEDMIKLRKNYPEHIVPMDGLVLTAGIDVQHNRFAYVIRAWGRNGNSWLVSWKEIFGNVLNYQDKVWEELTNIMSSSIPHASGKSLPISGISIDSGDNTELVYRWVLQMNAINPCVYATKGVGELKYSADEIYNEPNDLDVITYKQTRRSLAETMGVKVYIIGAHKAHDEILRRIGLNTISDCKHDVYYFNEQSYGMYEEQMTSCRKLIDLSGNTQRERYKLVAGKRKEAMDAEKNSLHASYAIGIPRYTSEHWLAIEKYLYDTK